MRLFQRLKERVERLRARAQHERAIAVGFARPTAKLLLRLGLLQTKGPISFERFVYRIYWWVMFIIVFVASVALNPGPGEATIYFGVLLALIFGWLFAMPQVAQMLAVEFAPRARWGDVLSGLLDSLRQEKLKVPDLSPEEKASLSKAADRFAPQMIPLALLQILFTLSVRALLLAALAILGLLVGSRIAAATWWPGWSPIALGYAATVPDALAMLASLTIPVFGQTILAALRVEEAARELGDDDGEPDEPKTTT